MFSKAKKIGSFSAVAAALILLASCSMDLTRLNQIDYPKVIPFFEPIHILFNGESHPLDVQLQRAYTAAVDTVSYPMESCRGNVDIEARVLPDSVNAAWYTPLTIFPLWPAMPINETWNYHMTVRIFCNGSLTYKAEFDEFEKVKAFWYGKLRADLVNEASEAMHQRLLERLRYELKSNRNSDLNSGMS